MEACGLVGASLFEGNLSVTTPIDGSEIACIRVDSEEEVLKKIRAARKAFSSWREVPPPRRGQLVRLIGEELRESKARLGRLISLESGKILEEGLGEVQEMIDICEFAVGLSRQLYGLTIASERRGHSIRENWLPLGVCGVITAFNFPVAPWSWNAALALVCGDPVIWKPSEKTPLCAIAVQKICKRAMSRFGSDAPVGLIQLAIGTRETGRLLTSNQDVAVVSATGSIPMGKAVASDIAKRLGRSILELGGNNAMIVTPSADQDMALRAAAFSAVGTAGQRCTSLRRMFVHEDIYNELVPRLVASYKSLSIGNPLVERTLVGPLVDRDAYESMQNALKQAKSDGGTVTGGTRVLKDAHPDAYYVRPAIVEMPIQSPIVCEETFAPIVYVMKYVDLEEVIEIHNAVPQGLSSSIFSIDVRETEYFSSASGSDCGIVNVNLGTSGAEIGGAFGGEKETGGGRESGSDAWKAYMRRQTNTVNYSRHLPLAQGIEFGVAKGGAK
jgi:aldehyde dehydrogenase (NAD+)